MMGELALENGSLLTKGVSAKSLVLFLQFTLKIRLNSVRD
jgi:hypothetical protein